MSAHNNSASIHVLAPSTRAGRDAGNIRGRSASPESWSDVAEHLSYIGGRRVLVRLMIQHLMIQDMPEETQSGFFPGHMDIHALLSRALQKMMDHAHLSLLQNDGRYRQGDTEADISPNEETETRPLLPENATVLRVGPLELDLLDRTAKRGSRAIDLRPREFQLLKYMMQRSEQLLTRATLLKEVWRYQFVPETNLVDVHMGRLRRKVDAPNDHPMIRNVRGVGFILNAAPSWPIPSAKPGSVPVTPCRDK